MAHRIAGEEITLIGHSHGGNVIMQAADMIAELTGVKVNIITIATPAYNGSNDVENPSNHKESINDHIHVYNKIDRVQSTAGDRSYSNEKTRNYEIKVSEFYKATDAIKAHSFDAYHPSTIARANIPKLKPAGKFESKKTTSKEVKTSHKTVRYL